MPYQFSNNDIIGRGGMGCVYRGHDQNGNVVAIKMMSNQVTCIPEYRDLFYSEVDTLRRMNNPSVVHIVGDPFSDSAGNLYLPMEFVNGKTIEQYVRENGPMSENAVRNMMGKILDAVQYIHNNRCIHRDIKPSNIMIRNGNDDICIIDFGIAKDSKVGATGRTVGRIIGTDGYMSPEQAAGLNIDSRTDIYSLGCVMFYMLTGKPAIPNQNNSYETINAILNSQLPLPSSIRPGISSMWDDVFKKATDKNMTRRFQTADEFWRALVDGQSAGPTHSISIPTVTVGRAADNNISINNDYVSRHHLVIRGLETLNTGGGTSYQIEIEDISNNGTGLNGRRIHHQTETIDYTSTAQLPQVLLSGRAECELDWNRVIRELKQRGWQSGAAQHVPQPSGQQYPSSGQNYNNVPPVPTNPNDKLDTGMAVICFIVPLLGWILWAVWKQEYPHKASSSAKWAWIGFAVQFVFNILMTIFIIILNEY